MKIDERHHIEVSQKEKRFIDNRFDKDVKYGQEYLHNIWTSTNTTQLDPSNPPLDGTQLEPAQKRAKATLLSGKTGGQST